MAIRQAGQFVANRTKTYLGIFRGIRHTKVGLLCLVAQEQNLLPSNHAVEASNNLEMKMSSEQQRRESERLSSMQEHPYVLIKHVDGSTVRLIEGSGYSINKSVGGMLLLLPEEVDKRQVFEIQVRSQTTSEQFAKLGEVRWTRPIPVEDRVNMHLVGVHFLFELPVSDQSSPSY
ncbi:MAG: PilZ domain-containing protein [Nitrospiraceae bacterium]|nr:PilZ domain-containing protein [Nitrospiraceae bacterium]